MSGHPLEFHAGESNGCGELLLFPETAIGDLVSASLTRTVIGERMSGNRAIDDIENLDEASNTTAKRRGSSWRLAEEASHCVCAAVRWVR
jgi:hypothetical protein